MKMQTTAVDIATYINNVYGVNGMLQLQKLVYYAEAWAQVWGGSLFDEKIEAWRMGPVVPEVRNVGCSIMSNRPVPVLPENVRHLLDSVVPFYKPFHGGQLRDRTHQEVPWSEVYVSGMNNEITRGSMKRYYAKQAILCPDDAPDPPIIRREEFTCEQIEQQAERLSTKWRRTLEILAQ